MEEISNGVSAFAQAIIDSSVSIVTGYPGGPATEILEKVSQNPTGAHVNWSVNEKQAVAMASGASMAGMRSTVIIKHVGLNIASDAVIGSALNGTKGGLVLLVGDDPGALMSQNEQDSRAYRELLNIPILEPSTVNEAYLMTRSAFRLSEEYQFPVIVRFINKIKHLEGKILTDTQKLQKQEKGFSRSKRWIPTDPPKKHLELHEKMNQLKDKIPEFEFNREITFNPPNREAGIIVSGPILHVVEKEINNLVRKPELFLVGVVNPLPIEQLKKFVGDRKKLLIVEEGEPIIENSLHLLYQDKQIFGRNSSHIPYQGNLRREDIAEALRTFSKPKSVIHAEGKKRNRIPNPPWEGIQSCPIERGHRILKKALGPIRDKAVIVGDTGCVCWGFVEPYNTVDSFLCMGTSASVAGGLDMGRGSEHSVAIMGDSSFLHSGIQALLDAVYQGADILFIIFDNGITGETGGQPNPGTGKNILGEETVRIKLEDFIKSCQVSKFDSVRVEKETLAVKKVSSYLKESGVRVLILRGRCSEECVNN